MPNWVNKLKFTSIHDEWCDAIIQQFRGIDACLPLGANTLASNFNIHQRKSAKKQWELTALSWILIKRLEKSEAVRGSFFLHHQGSMLITKGKGINQNELLRDKFNFSSCLLELKRKLKLSGIFELRFDANAISERLVELLLGQKAFAVWRINFEEFNTKIFSEMRLIGAKRQKKTFSCLVLMMSHSTV